MLRKVNQAIVISEVDIKAALDHYKRLPLTVTNKMPSGWGKTQIIAWVKDALSAKVKDGDIFDVGTGVWAHIKPLGYEFMNYPSKEHRLQVILSFRPVSTDLDNLITLG